jgi:hypothetical protein
MSETLVTCGASDAPSKWSVFFTIQSDVIRSTVELEAANLERAEQGSHEVP